MLQRIYSLALEILKERKYSSAVNYGWGDHMDDLIFSALDQGIRWQTINKVLLLARGR